MFKLWLEVRTASGITREGYLPQVKGTKDEVALWLEKRVTHWISENGYSVVTKRVGSLLISSAQVYRSKNEDYPFLTLTVVDAEADQERMTGV